MHACKPNPPETADAELTAASHRCANVHRLELGRDAEAQAVLSECLKLDPVDGINARHLQAPLLLRLGKHAEVEMLLGAWPADTAAVMLLSMLLLRLAAWGKAETADSDAKEAEAETAFEAAFAANWHAVRASLPSRRPPRCPRIGHLPPQPPLTPPSSPSSRADWATPARVLCRQCVVLAAQETAATSVPENMCNALREQRAEAAQKWAAAAAKARAGQPVVAAAAAGAAGGVEEALLLCDTFGGWSMDEEPEEEGDSVGWPGLGAGDVWLAGQVLRQAAPTQVGVKQDSRRSVALFNGAAGWPSIQGPHLAHTILRRRAEPRACHRPPGATARCPVPATRRPPSTPAAARRPHTSHCGSLLPPSPRLTSRRRAVRQVCSMGRWRRCSSS